MEKYIPNFNDSRVLATIKRGLNFVELYTKQNQVSSISSTQLYKNFGNTSRPLGRWLVENLLVVRDPYYNPETGVCKKYSKNDPGVARVKQLAGLTNSPIVIPEVIEQQMASGNFEYTLKSNRLFTTAQYIPKRIRNEALNRHGYKYHYDISAAAPRLLIQRAQQLNANISFPALEHYVNNRKEIRQQLSTECEISEDKIKTVINSILQGGVISAWPSNKTFCDLNYDHNAVIKLNNNPTMISLKLDIKSLWKSLSSEFSVRHITDKNGKQRKKKLSGRDKSSYYRELELEVGVVIRRLLKKNRVRELWIHDGWVCDKAIDPSLIVTEVRRQTGFVLELDWTIYEEC